MGSHSEVRSNGVFSVSEAVKSYYGGEIKSHNNVAVPEGAERPHGTPKAMECSQCPAVANVYKSSKVHIGPKVEYVTQNVTNNEVIKELSLGQYLVRVVKNTSRGERYAFVAVLLAIIICIVVIVYFNMNIAKTDQNEDKGQQEWYITREMWLAAPFNESDSSQEYEPLKLVVINHSVSNECHRFINCAAELRNLQDYFIKKKKYDIPYNFIIGNDGRVYVGRGWGLIGAHTYRYNTCSLGIGFLGDYREVSMNTKVTELQVERVHMLLALGVQLGRLHPDYVIVGAKDVRPSESPGETLYNVMTTWEHYNRDRYHNMTCEQIISSNL